MLPEDEEETLQKKTLKPRRRGSAPQTRIAGRGRRSRGNDNNQLPQDSTTTKKKILARSPLDKIPIAEAVVPTACRMAPWRSATILRDFHGNVLVMRRCDTTSVPSGLLESMGSKVTRTVHHLARESRRV
jgi:hypothetical protein